MLLLLQSPHLLKHNFLHGDPSPLRFVQQNKMLDVGDFVYHADQFYHGRSSEFCKELVLTFQQVTVHDRTRVLDINDYWLLQVISDYWLLVVSDYWMLVTTGY